jgi:competence protein ComEA
MSWKQVAADYFSFTRKERIAVFILVLLVVFVLITPAGIRENTGSKAAVTPDTGWIAAIKKIERRAENSEESSQANHPQRSYNRPPGANTHTNKGELFYFDPNKLDSAGWKKLGLRDKTIKIIQNYLAKGGHFYKPADLSKVYGLFDDEYRRLEPFIRIEAGKPDRQNSNSGKSSPYTIKKEVTSIIDINTADTSAWIALPGIGSKLANRIVNFRDKLGGFYSVNQVGETFGLQDSVFQKLKVFLRLENASIRKININTATQDQLKAHPYIRYSIANAIIAYRNEHGPFNSIEDLKKVMVITEDIFIKISGYITIGD